MSTSTKRRVRPTRAPLERSAGNGVAVLKDKHAAGTGVLEVTLATHDGGTLVATAHSGLPAATGTGTNSAGDITWPAWRWPLQGVIGATARDTG